MEREIEPRAVFPWKTIRRKVPFWGYVQPYLKCIYGPSKSLEVNNNKNIVAVNCFPHKMSDKSEHVHSTEQTLMLVNFSESVNFTTVGILNVCCIAICTFCSGSVDRSRQTYKGCPALFA